MAAEREKLRALIASGGQKGADFLRERLDPEQYEPILTVSSGSEVRRRLSEEGWDIVLINAPLKDEFGTELAVEIAESEASGVALLVKSDVYESVACRAEDAGVYCILKPLSLQALSQALHLIAATRARLARARQKTESLKSKMEEIRLVNRAKLLLMEKLGVGEAAAHRYIEKQAMDMCVKRARIAEQIISTYEN